MTDALDTLDTLRVAVLDAEDLVASLSREAVKAEEAYRAAWSRAKAKRTAKVQTLEAASILADQALEQAEEALAKVRQQYDRQSRQITRAAVLAKAQAEAARQLVLF